MGEDVKVAMVEAIDKIEFTDFPVPNTIQRVPSLSGSGITEEPASKTEIVSYNSEDSNSIAKFTYKFTQKSGLIGLPKAVLYRSAPSHDNMNVFIVLCKRSNDGKLLMHLTYPFSAKPQRVQDH